MDCIYRKNRVGCFCQTAVIGAFLVLLAATGSVAEIIHLHDGQVINGEIVERGDGFIKVKTRYQVRYLGLGTIKKIEKERRGLDRVYILTRENTVIAGYLVEEDSLQVVYRDAPDTADKNISKLDVLRMSNEEIRPIDMEFRFRPGAFIPLNTGGADLGLATAYTGSIGINAMFVPRLRFLLDVGFARSENDGNPGRYLQVVPVTLSAAFRFSLTRQFEVIPRMGLGGAALDYHSGEGDELATVSAAFVAGLTFSFALAPRRFYLGIYGDYLLLYDFSGALHTVVTGVFAGFRL